MDVLDLQFGRSIIPFSQVGILTYKFLALSKINFNLIYFFIISILFTRRIEYGHDFCYRFFSFLFLYHFSTRNACCISCWFYDKWGIVCGSWNVKNMFNKRNTIVRGKQKRASNWFRVIQLPHSESNPQQMSWSLAMMGEGEIQLIHVQIYSNSREKPLRLLTSFHHSTRIQ